MSPIDLLFINTVLNMQNVIIDQVLDPGTRVTVAMGTDRNLDAGKQLIFISLQLFTHVKFLNALVKIYPSMTTS